MARSGVGPNPMIIACFNFFRNQVCFFFQLNRISMAASLLTPKLNISPSGGKYFPCINELPSLIKAEIKLVHPRRAFCYREQRKHWIRLCCIDGNLGHEMKSRSGETERKQREDECGTVAWRPTSSKGPWSDPEQRNSSLILESKKPDLFTTAWGFCVCVFFFMKSHVTYFSLITCIIVT